MSRWRPLLVVGALLVALGAAACGGLPQSGPVIAGLPLDEPIIDPIRIAPQGPLVGADPVQIALGFVRAGEDANETRDTGKSFLTPSSVDLWRWSATDVVVYGSPRALQARLVDEESVEVSVPALGVLTPAGRYNEVPVGTVKKVTFEVTKVGGEWRIQLPATGFGLWLHREAFTRLYTNRSVYFVSPGRDLVPDPRWFPTGPRLATSIARAQLDPVPDHLTGALVSGVPLNTKLAVNAVPIANGKALINLSADVLRAGPDERQAMWAQLAAALAKAPGVRSIGLAANDNSLDLPNGATSISSPGELDYGTVPTPAFEDVLLRTGERFRRIAPRFIPDSPSSRQAVVPKARDGDPVTIPDNWTKLAVSVDGSDIAAVGGDNKQLSRWPAHEPSFTVPMGEVSQLSRPTFDAAGFLWVAGADRAGAHHVWVLNATSKDPNQRPQAVSARWLTGRKVIALTPASDASRLLIITTKRDGTDVRLGLTGIVRGLDGTPISLAEPLRQAEPLRLMKDVAWLGPETYAVLGRVEPKEPVEVWFGTIGAGLEGISLGTPKQPDRRATLVAKGLSITTVAGAHGLIVITDDSQVLARAGSTWRRIDSGTDVLVPGR